VPASKNQNKSGHRPRAYLPAGLRKARGEPERRAAVAAAVSAFVVSNRQDALTAYEKNNPCAGVIPRNGLSISIGGFSNQAL
jgi:hypothetical protein